VTGTGSGDSGVTATSPSSILVTANHLVFSSVPSTVVSGAQFSVTVLAEDVNGHKDPTFTGQVTLGKFSGPGSLSGSLPVTANDGEADFTGLSLDHWGDYTLQATTPNLDSTGPSSTITVTASQLVFTTFPTAAVQSDHNFTVVVSAEDILGNTAGNF